MEELSPVLRLSRASSPAVPTKPVANVHPVTGPDACDGGPCAIGGALSADRLDLKASASPRSVTKT